METQHGESDSWAVLSLRQVPTAARHARAAMSSVLVRLGLGRQFRADAELVLNELVANAVEHGSADREGMIEAAWRLTPDRLVLRVRDSGKAARLEPGTLEHGHGGPNVRGRGLAIVDAVSSAWSYEVGLDGTEVTAVLMRGDHS
ncbi:Anti-sigma regulatory factor (Ser/Thr protein kinase) [Nocardioides terrae]|uniref:Anti-sigma regulatory factor (Ser/Thr protein kinase) n=1 Tax=Nocardioides terrae TaxID=574651 RepID=A0A1I1L5P3_9ACTN|nr:ATP-binding protein [Nocardioides terrae]SFC68374.1 Anti-sigma regulatory factor (Ser/Thr protein kinase) [Nocardioides terrae]